MLQLYAMPIPEFMELSGADPASPARPSVEIKDSLPNLVRFHKIVGSIILMLRR